ncbi:MAG: GNAT family N-acetyltransferase [Kiloniellaceae bacterium]
MTIRLETERLVLRPFAAADAGAVQASCSLWEVARMTTRIAHPYPEGAATAWIASHDAARDEGAEYVFAITLKTDGEADAVIGAGGLHKIAQGNFELGYWLAPQHWGRGLASEAARAMVVYGFEKLGAEALNSGYFTDNPASGRVLEKAGFRANGIARQWSEARRDFVDANRLLLTRESWRQALKQASESAQ